jgi:glutamate decarboxylase
MTTEQVLGIRPNLVISSCFQAAWEKFFRYFDVEPRFVKPSVKDFCIIPSEIAELCDDKTMGVVGILGNHYNGAYDAIWEMNDVISQVNEENGFQIGIHIDAASGGFIAPFQENMPPFDFRLSNVLSISASGHKFGESICGTGWVVFRQREDLTEHIAISVSYLGGHCDSITLNFSRPASGCYVQMYKFLRLGLQGYRSKVANQMHVAAFIRSQLREIKRPDGKPRFTMMDTGDIHCLPVVAAQLNNADGSMSYDDIDLQHALAESHWYVSGYGLTFENLATGKVESLFRDADEKATMFRVVVKSNLTMMLAIDLVRHINWVLPVLDKHGFHSIKTHRFRDVGKMVMMLKHKAC